MGYLDGKQIVDGCSCNGATEYEEFIWAHRGIIVEYFRLRTTKELKEAQENSNLSKSVYDLIK